MGIGAGLANTLLRLVQREEYGGVGGGERPDGDAQVVLLDAAAALNGGEPKRGGRLLDAASFVPGSEEAAVAEALSRLAATLDCNWLPGGSGTVLEEGDLARLDRGDMNPTSGEAGIVVLVAARCLVLLPAWRRVVAGARRMGNQGRMARTLQDVDEVGRDIAAYGVARASAYFAMVRADLLWRAGQPAEATAAIQGAVDAYRDLGDLAGVGAALLVQGDWMAEPVSHPEVLGLDLSAPELAPPSGPPPKRASARQLYERAADSFTKAGARRGSAAVELRLAHLDAAASQHQAAREHLSRAQALAAEAGDRALAYLAAVHEGLRPFAEGEEREPTAGEAVSTWATTDGSTSFGRGLAQLCHSRARWYRERGDFLSARLALRSAEAIHAGLGTATGPALLRGEAAELYGGANYRRAVFVLTDLELAEGINYRERAGGPPDAVAWLGLAKQAMDSFGAAAALMDADALERAQRRFQWLADHPPPPEGAESPVTDVQASVRNTISQAAGLIPLYRATAARERGWLEEAEHDFEVALAAAEAMGPEGTFLAMLVYGHRRQKDKGVPLADALVASNFLLPEQAGELYLRLRAPEKAKAELAKADALGAPATGRPWEALGRRAEMHADLGELDEAAPLAARAVELFEEHLARLTRDVLRVTATDDVFVTRLYTTALQVHLARGGEDGVAAAFRLSDRCRGIALADLLASDQAAGADPPVVAAIREWHRRGAELARTFEEVASSAGPPDPAAVRQRIAQAERALDDAEAAVQRVAPQILAGRRRPPPSPALAELQPLVPPETVLVQYHAYDDELVGWAVSRDGARATRTRVETARLAGLSARFHRACSSPGSGPGERLKLGTELAELVLGPLQAQVDGFERLVVVPHGNLNLIPFHLLPWEGGLLADRQMVSYLPAAFLLPRWAGARTVPRLGRSAVIVGDPDYSTGRGLPPLRGARTEAAAVARLLGVKPLIGAEAVGPAVEAAIPSARILHLATHGLLRENAPSSTELALAGEDALTIPDLLGLDTDIDLAVLSACHSGRGRATTSGDVVGLTRALFAAGARDLVVSLWPVDDVAGCLVMVGFYEQLAAGRDITRSLANAVAHVRALHPSAHQAAYAELCGEAAAAPHVARDWQAAVTIPEASDDADHPYWWGPFVHIGL